MRKIFLPSLKSIRIQNYTLYPNGLDYTYDFVNGVNLILGGNGMGKTTFVNIIKYALIGNYKKQFDYTRTYIGRKIEKRTLFHNDYFKNRMDQSILLEEAPTVTISFAINNHLFVVERDLSNMILRSFSVDSVSYSGKIINQQKYEDIKSDSDKEECLIYKYEQELEKKSGFTFDDLIFFVNEILFFGEDHKTILWNDGIGTVGTDVQGELINRYFNPPELELERQDAERQAKYFDSRARHTQEEIKAIRKVLDKVSNSKNKNTNYSILELRDEIDNLIKKISISQEEWKVLEDKISMLNSQAGQKSLLVEELDANEKIAENNFLRKIWEKLNPKYEIYKKNIVSNHKCPMCNQYNEGFSQKVINSTNTCFTCGEELKYIEDKALNVELEKNIKIRKDTYYEIQQLQIEIHKLETEKKDNYNQFKKLELEKKSKQKTLIELEYDKSLDGKPDQLQAFYDEIAELEKIKNEYQEASKLEREKADRISTQKETEVLKNVKEFSSLFSSFASQFLGVPCKLTYGKYGTDTNMRFYPIINDKIRFNEEELSESQRFFVDHSFRMSILSFFYTTPAFYIVETPDSSLDISYERNAANVFLRFLERPNTLIITSNLNNNTFINHIIENTDIKVSLIELLDIAKRSTIQKANESLLSIYNEIKNKIKGKIE